MLFKTNKAKIFLRNDLLGLPNTNPVHKQAFDGLSKDEEKNIKVSVIKGIVADATNYKVNCVILKDVVAETVAGIETKEKCLQYCETDKELLKMIDDKIVNHVKTTIEFVYSANNIQKDSFSPETVKLIEYVGEDTIKPIICKTILNELFMHCDGEFVDLVTELVLGEISCSDSFVKHLQTIRPFVEGKTPVALTALETLLRTDAAPEEALQELRTATKAEMSEYFGIVWDEVVDTEKQETVTSEENTDPLTGKSEEVVDMTPPTMEETIVEEQGETIVENGDEEQETPTMSKKQQSKKGNKSSK